MNAASLTSPTPAPAADTPLLQIRDLRLGFRTARQAPPTLALTGISFDIPAQRTLALVGESGSGKSVTALALLGLLPPDATWIDPASRILYGERELLSLAEHERRRLRGRDIAMIFQEPMSSLNPLHQVGSQISEVLRLHLGMSRRAAWARSIELLDEVGLPEPQRRVHSYPFELSGGQQQRVMIAMAIACQPRLLIADEPTTALDVTIQRQILELLQEVQARHRMAMLFITHDLAVVADIADRVVVMRHGQIREQGNTATLFAQPQDAYTQALLACRPPRHGRPQRLMVIDDFLAQAPASRASTTADTEGAIAASAAHSTHTTHAPHASSVTPPTERPRGIREHDAVILEVNHLGKSFYRRRGLWQHDEFKAVADVSFRLYRGRTLGVVGESGCGKTTLGLTLMRLHAASHGQALFAGRDLLTMNRQTFQPYKRRLQIVFQNPYAALNPRFTVAHILEEPLLIHGLETSPGARQQRVLQLLERVGLPASAASRYPHEFSGGQRQRIAIARCLALQPEILICDESVSALDVSVQAQILNLLQDLQDDYGMSYMFISHDLDVVRYMSDELLVMRAGRVIEYGNTDRLYAAPQQDYTRQLLAAQPG